MKYAFGTPAIDGTGNWIITVLFAALFICGVMITPISVVEEVSGVPDKDIDNAGNHIVRDDDGTKETTIAQQAGDEIYKRLWVYYNNIEDADRIHLWIYGRVYDGVQAGESHEIFINNRLVMKFAAKECFVPGEFRWRAFELDASDLSVGGCNEICIRAKSGVSATIEYGVDKSFARVNDPAGTCYDFDRSYWYDSAPTPTMYLPDQFAGEFMINLEFVAVYEDRSEGFQKETTVNKQLSYTSDQPGGSDWDSAGIILDWTDMDGDEFGKIYKVRLWIYCKPEGDINLNDDDTLAIEVNGNIQWEFNPYKELPRVTFSWMIVTLYDMDDPTTWHLINGWPNGYNKINIVNQDEDDDDNNLRIAYLSDVDNGLNYPSTWWYIKTGSDPDTYDGEYEDPDECSGELVMYVEVFLSDELKSSNAKMFKYGSSGLIDNRDGDFNGFNLNGVNGLLADFNGYSDYGGNFLVTGKDVRQWTIYGESRSPSETQVGDTCDIYVHYGPGDPDRPNNVGVVTLYEGRKVNGQWSFGDDAYHNNDDRHDFTSVGVSLTEAEGNDFSIAEEDDGSNGFSNDLEWIFFFTPGTFTDGANSWFQTLLWHGSHAVFGFDDVTPQTLSQMVDDLHYYYLSASVVEVAFESLCDAYDVEGMYFLNTDHDLEMIWGEMGNHNADSLDRSKIQFDTTQ